MPHYPQAPPPGIRRIIWYWIVKFEATFALSMMQPWEKALIIFTLLSITLLFWVSVITYYPKHLAYLSRRFAYYVYEDENADVKGYLKEWFWQQFRRAGAGIGIGTKGEL